MKNVGNSSRGRSQKVPKIFREPIAHCAVIFVTAQLSCSCSKRFVGDAYWRTYSCAQYAMVTMSALRCPPLAPSGTPLELGRVPSYEHIVISVESSITAQGRDVLNRVDAAAIFFNRFCRLKSNMKAVFTHYSSGVQPQGMRAD